KSASTPFDTKKPLLKDPDGEDVDVHTYRSMIDSLMYLTSSRPDIMFAIYACAHFQVTLKSSHLHAVKRIFSCCKLLCSSTMDSKSVAGLWGRSAAADKLGHLLRNHELNTRKLQKKRKLKVSGLKRLRKVGTAQRVKSSANTVMDDQEDASKQGEIVKLYIDEDVTLEEVAAEVAKDAEDDEVEPSKLKEVIEVVTTAKLMTEVVTAAATTITDAPSAAKRRKGVVIRDPKERATLSIIVHSEPKSKDKGKGILVEEPKPLKKQAQVKRKEKQDNAVLRYQALKRKPQTKAQARKNMMVYLKNMAGFKIDFFKGMSYDDIRPIFEKHFNSIVAFLEKGEEQLEEDASKALKKKSESLEQQAAKKQKLDEEVHVVDYQIHTKNNKPYYKIIRANGTHQLFLSFISLLMNFNREDLEMLWQINQKRFVSLKSKNFSNDFLLNTLKAMFEKPNVEASIWKNQRGRYGLAKVKSWKLLESCGVHIITFTTTHMILLVVRRYPLTRFTLDQMLNNVRLEVEEESEVSLELLRSVRR
nr:hypothetical protein [Tanacetum cinerariifolium]